MSSLRTPLTSITRIALVVGAACLGGSLTAAERSAAAGTAIDHRSLPDGALPAAVITQAASVNAVLVTAPGHQALVEGFRRLIESHPELRVTRSPSATWYRRNHGTGVFRSGGRGAPDERAERHVRVLDDRLGAAVDAAGLMFASNDISHGNRLETATVWRRQARMDIRHGHSRITDVTTDNITTVANVNGVPTVANYPIELPNVESFNIGTSVVIPAGYGRLPPMPVAQAVPHARHPVMAFAGYREAIDQVATQHPDLTAIWITAPLRADGNMQRFAFNQYLRVEAHQRGAILLDAAMILSHDRAGQVAMAADGYPATHADWLDDDGDLNQAAEDRLAAAWVLTLAAVASSRQPSASE